MVTLLKLEAVENIPETLAHLNLKLVSCIQ
jgi:hypothetical protein